MKILCLGDSPYIKTGFGVVNEVAVRELLDQGHEVVVLGGQDTKAREPMGTRMTYIPGKVDDSTDLLGWSKVVQVISDHAPDAVNIIGDPAMVTVWMIHPEVSRLPMVAYVPVEGAPLNFQWVNSFKQSENLRLITTSYYGQNVLADSGISSRMAYHGISDDFSHSPESGNAFRSKVGWTDDMFVVMCVAQNVGRKQWPRLFEAIGIAKKSYPKTYLYAHTVPFNNHFLDGHHLPQLAIEMGVWDNVMFPPGLTSHNDAISAKGDGEVPGLADLYNMADMFVLPSQVEGFGIPLVEAMRSGLPVATTDYAAGAEVVGSAGIRLPVHDWTYNRSHSKYANVAPRDISDAILRVAKNPELRKRYRAKSLERSKAFSWDDYRSILKELFGGIEAKAQAA